MDNKTKMMRENRLGANSFNWEIAAQETEVYFQTCVGSHHLCTLIAQLANGNHLLIFLCKVPWGV